MQRRIHWNLLFKPRSPSGTEFHYKAGIFDPDAAPIITDCRYLPRSGRRIAAHNRNRGIGDHKKAASKNSTGKDSFRKQDKLYIST